MGSSVISNPARAWQQATTTGERSLRIVQDDKPEPNRFAARHSPQGFLHGSFV